MAKDKKKSKGSSRSSMRDRMRERANTREQSGRGGAKFIFPEGREVKFLKIDKAGTRKLDFLPYEVTDKKHPAGVEAGDLWYQRTIFTHNNVGPEEKSYLCLKSRGKKCPICDYAAQLQKDPKADEELIKSLRAKEREVFNVIDRSSNSDEILLWEFSYHLFGKLLEEEIRNAEPDEDYKAGFADLEGGSTLKVRFDSKKMGKNEFFEAKRIDFLDRDDYDESILEEVLPLDDILNVLDYEKLEAIFLDTDPEPDEKPDRSKKRKKDEEEEEEDEKPKRSSRRGKKDEEEEEEDEKPKRGRSAKADEEDEEDEEPPRRSSKRGKKDEEEEPEDEKPAKKSAKKSKKDEDDEECIGGGTFGEDEGEFNECMDCECWDECKEASAKKKKKSRR